MRVEFDCSKVTSNKEGPGLGKQPGEKEAWVQIRVLLRCSWVTLA